jgi:hypothetical protein
MFNTFKYVTGLALYGFMLLIPSFSWAQKGLVFKETEINLGYIPEDTGHVVVDFYCSNPTKSSLVLVDVDTHGGASVVHWPKDSILPGQKNKISVKLNPNNRPGSFERKVSLRSMPDSADYLLVVKAYVEPSEKVWTENSNETKVGAVVLSSDYVRVGTVSENSKVEKTIKVKNTGKDPVVFGFSKAKIPTYISIKGLPEKLLPGVEAMLTMSIDFAAAQKLGKYIDMIELPMGKGDQQLMIYVIGKIMPVAPVLANKPIVDMLTKEVDFQEVSSDKLLQGSFVIKNIGLSPLLVRKVETSCTCIHVDSSTPIAPGSTANLYFTFDPRGLKGIEEKRIVLYTNAPDQPIIQLLVRVKVNP